MPDQSQTHTLVEGAVAALVVLKGVVDHFGGKRRNRHSDSLRQSVDALRSTVTKELGEFRKDIDDLFAHVVGPDGKNGLRSRVEDLEETTADIERRERERLERTVGTLDRRAAS